MSAGMIRELKPKLISLIFSLLLHKISYSVTSDAKYPGHRDTCNDVTDRQMNMHGVILAREISAVTILRTYAHTVNC